MKTSKIRIMIADDFEMLRKSCIALIEKDQELEVIGDASDGKELIEKMKENLPDVVLLDIDMPVMGGRSAMEIIKRRFPEVRLLIFSYQSDTNIITEFMSDGAHGFISKDCKTEVLFNAIKAVHKEGYYFNQFVSKALLGNILKDKKFAGNLDHVDFSAREKIIIRHIWQGMNNREIASAIHVSPSTVDAARGRIYSKTNCSTAISLVRFALQRGIISIQD